MNILRELQDRFRAALAGLCDDPSELVELVRPSQDPKFGDYQANLAMPLGKRLGRAPREVAQEVVGRLKVDDLCEPPEVAGPGFINLRLRTPWLAAQLARASADPRLGIQPVGRPRTYVVDYSAPNVAKPMHVGHIRSTVIGDSLVRTLRFLGHRVITDNHIGDWGTQFGMIIYGYKHFLDPGAYRQNPVQELSRLYRLVNQLVEYHEGRGRLPQLEARLQVQRDQLAQQKTATGAAPPTDKHAAKALRRAENDLRSDEQELAALKTKLAVIEASPQLAELAGRHADIAEAVLAETAKLHHDDPENLRLWHEFLPPCLVEIQRIYDRLGVKFDHTLGESFYHDRLTTVVDELTRLGIARPSEGATCIFLDGFATPMIVRKQDGAFLYATTDLATIQYRVGQWKPDAVLYVVDHRQSLHFEQLFAAARLWGYRDLQLVHVSFGTVLGDDGRPFKTRSGDTVGLESLLDEAVRRAFEVVSAGDDAKPGGAELAATDRAKIAETVGIAGLKYADLSQNRTSDYVFSYDKMLLLTGNTATYMQYAYARVQNIFARGKIDVARLRASNVALELEHPAERALGLELLRFSEALEMAAADFRPNVLTTYLFELAGRYSTFYESCPVLQAETAELRDRRLLLGDLTARTIRQGLELLGIDVVDRM